MNFFKNIFNIRPSTFLVRNLTELNSERKWFDAIPGPTKHPILNHIRNFAPIIGKHKATKIFEYHSELHRKYGPIVAERTSSGNVLVHIFNIEDVETILTKETFFPVRAQGGTIGKGRRENKDQFKYAGAFGVSGKEWYESRRLLHFKMLEKENLSNYMSIIDKTSSQFIDLIDGLRNEKQEVSNIMYKLMNYVTESMFLALLNKSIGALDVNPPPDSELFKKSITKLFGCLHELEDAHVIKRNFKFLKRKAFREFLETQACIDRLINKYTNIPSISTEEKDRLKTILHDMFIGGVDTTSIMLTTLLYNLSRYPLVQEKLYECLSGVNRPEDIIEHPYLKQCIKESLRLHPVFLVLSRVLQKAVNVSGHEIPKGTTILCHHGQICRLDKYFENATEFLPERWPIANRLVNNFAARPFGFGARMCPGRNIAEIKIALLIAKIVRKYRIEYRYPDFEFTFKAISQPKSDLNITFIDR